MAVTRISDMRGSRQFDQRIFYDGLLGHNLEHRNASHHSTKPVDFWGDSNGWLCQYQGSQHCNATGAGEDQHSNKNLATERPRDSAAQTQF